MATLSQLFGESISIVGESLGSISRNALNSLYPKEFEAYFLSLELTDFYDNIEEYFTFPVNPSFISKTESRTKSINRTFGKIVVNKSDFFTPQDIVIKGNFGRNFKILIRHKGELNFNSILSKTTIFTQNEFSSNIKSGYGSFKILQSICERADKSIEGDPKKLYLHNYFLGESYLVEVIDFSGDQSLQTNMMWGYTLRLKVISPINVSKKDKLNGSITGMGQNALNKSLGSVKKVLGSML